MIYRHVEDMPVYHLTIDLIEEVYRLTHKEQLARDFGYVDQIRRAAISVGPNIAEGFGRYTTHREFARFVALSRGSAFEVRLLLVAGHRIGYLNVNEYQRPLAMVDDLIRQLAGLSRYLRNKSRS